jgi:hypothetical protein
MGSMKLFVLLIVILLFVLWKKYQKRLEDLKAQGRDASSQPNANQAASSPAILELLPCSVCGVHSDKSSLSLNANGQFVCDQHRHDLH